MFLLDPLLELSDGRIAAHFHQQVRSTRRFPYRNCNVRCHLRRCVCGPQVKRRATWARIVLTTSVPVRSKINTWIHNHAHPAHKIVQLQRGRTLLCEMLQGTVVSLHATLVEISQP